MKNYDFTTKPYVPTPKRIKKLDAIFLFYHATKHVNGLSEAKQIIEQNFTDLPDYTDLIDLKDFGCLLQAWILQEEKANNKKEDYYKNY